MNCYFRGLSTPRAQAILTILFLGISAVPTAIAQSFNCRNATLPDEVLICKDTDLSRLDERVAGLYFTSLNQALGAAREAIEHSQATWLLARRSCGQDRSCIEQSYQTRIAQLSGYVQNASPSPNAADTYTSPHAYCRAVGTIDKPDQRYIGPKQPQSFWRRFDLDGSFGMLEWRCMDGSVYACGSGNSPICGKMDPYQNITAIKQFCRENPNDDFVPAAVMGRFPVEWACQGGKPFIKQGDFRVDKRGYPVEYWKLMYRDD